MKLDWKFDISFRRFLQCTLFLKRIILFASSLLFFGLSSRSNYIFNSKKFHQLVLHTYVQTPHIPFRDLNAIYLFKTTLYFHLPSVVQANVRRTNFSLLTTTAPEHWLWTVCKVPLENVKSCLWTLGTCKFLKHLHTISILTKCVANSRWFRRAKRVCLLLKRAVCGALLLDHSKALHFSTQMTSTTMQVLTTLCNKLFDLSHYLSLNFDLHVEGDGCNVLFNYISGI